MLLCDSRARSDRGTAAVTEHLVRMLPKNRSLPSSTSKEAVLEGDSDAAGLLQGGVSFAGSLPLGATYTFRGVTLGPDISLSQVPRDWSCETPRHNQRGCRVPQRPGAETQQHFPSVPGMAKPTPVPKSCSGAEGLRLRSPSSTFSSTF